MLFGAADARNLGTWADWLNNFVVRKLHLAHCRRCECGRFLHAIHPCRTDHNRSNSITDAKIEAAMPETAELYIGVDIGGTKVAAGLVNTNGELLYKTRNRMQAGGAAADGLASLRGGLDKVL